MCSTSETHFVCVGTCENDLFVKRANECSYVNAPIFLENKSQIRKVDEI